MHVKDPPVLTIPPVLNQNVRDGVVELHWKRIGQDITKLKVQMSREIPPNWSDVELPIDSPAVSEKKHFSTDRLEDGETYSVRLWFENKKGNGTSQPLTFIVPFTYLKEIDVQAEDISMSELTPKFHPKIFNYAIMVDESCEEILFYVTPLESIVKIESPILENGSTSIDRWYLEDIRTQGLYDSTFGAPVKS